MCKVCQAVVCGASRSSLRRFVDRTRSACRPFAAPLPGRPAPLRSGCPEPLAQLGERSGRQCETQQLWQALRGLRSPDQQVICPPFFLDPSAAEMAAMLEVAAGTVKSLPQ